MNAPTVVVSVERRVGGRGGVTVQDVQGILIAVAPAVGTPPVMAAAGNIARALGLAVALAEAELDHDA